MPASLVLGLDIGGTSTRALLVDTTGARLGTGRAGGANPTSHGPEAATVQLRIALDAALDGYDPALVRAGVIGMAGVGKLVSDPRARQSFEDAWRAAGLRCDYALEGDALVAFASATAAPSGTVLIAGTGAIAAEVRDLRLARIADGHGWLLGDNGSGFWLGREAARAALAVHDGSISDGLLTRAVRVALLGSPAIAADPRETASDIVQVVNARPPVKLAELAPIVLDAYDRDPLAQRLVAQAAEHLVATAALVHVPGAPTVLAGGMLTADTPLAAVTRTRIEERWPDPAPTSGPGAPASSAPTSGPGAPASSAPTSGPGAPASSAPLLAGDGAAAAAWLAARKLPEVADPAALHAALLTASVA